MASRPRAYTAFREHRAYTTSVGSIGNQRVPLSRLPANWSAPPRAAQQAFNRGLASRLAASGALRAAARAALRAVPVLGLALTAYDLYNLWQGQNVEPQPPVLPLPTRMWYHRSLGWLGPYPLNGPPPASWHIQSSTSFPAAPRGSMTTVTGPGSGNPWPDPSIIIAPPAPGLNTVLTYYGNAGAFVIPGYTVWAWSEWWERSQQPLPSFTPWETPVPITPQNPLVPNFPPYRYLPNNPVRPRVNPRRRPRREREPYRGVSIDITPGRWPRPAVTVTPNPIARRPEPGVKENKLTGKRGIVKGILWFNENIRDWVDWVGLIYENMYKPPKHVPIPADDILGRLAFLFDHWTGTNMDWDNLLWDVAEWYAQERFYGYLSGVNTQFSILLGNDQGIGVERVHGYDPIGGDELVSSLFEAIREYFGLHERFA